MSTYHDRVKAYTKAFHELGIENGLYLKDVPYLDLTIEARRAIHREALAAARIRTFPKKYTKLVRMRRYVRGHGYLWVTVEAKRLNVDNLTRKR